MSPRRVRRTPRFVAVDLGASNGRVFSAALESGQLRVEEHLRFENGGVPVRGRLYWDVFSLWRGVLDGLRTAARSGAVTSVGIDSWGVDYGLLDEDGQLIGAPLHYRDVRNAAALEQLKERMDPSELYRRNGTALLPIVTAVQLLAESPERLALARRMLLIPDLLCYWLTGQEGAEITNASTTGLLAAEGNRWDAELAAKLGIPPSLLAPIRRPGDHGGDVTPEVAADVGFGAPVPVTVIGSHDTASAVVAVPAEGREFAYISAGTWSLVGVELERPILNEDARQARFSNERGVDDTIRFLRNVMGLWLLQESLRTWKQSGQAVALDALLAEAEHLPALHWLIDADEADLLRPGDMPARIRAACAALGEDVPATPAQVVRCIVDSLALSHRRAIHEAEKLSNQRVQVVHVVGGGARNHLLCQATADACALPVVAGPVEATPVGNLLMQARAAGELSGDLAAMRACVRASTVLTRYEPRATSAWDEADERVPRPHSMGERRMS